MHAFLSAILVILALGVSTARASGPAQFPDSSLYQVETDWQRDDGKTMRLAELRGRVRVVSMFFTGCQNLCPMLMGQLKSLERSLPADLKKRVGFVMVSMDVKDDTPDALRKYRKESALSPENWILLRGSADDTRELAALLGVHYTPKQEDGQIGHTGVIAILDREGRIVYKVTGITDQNAFLAELTRNANPEH